MREKAWLFSLKTARLSCDILDPRITEEQQVDVVVDIDCKRGGYYCVAQDNASSAKSPFVGMLLRFLEQVLT